MSVVFKRTQSGISNQHLFHDVDLVVFVEGGKNQFSKEEVYAGEYNVETNDIIFWSGMFKLFVNDRKLKFKSVGSKSTLKKIASDIIDSGNVTAIVAMDKEFDEVYKDLIESPYVLYTFGYSWENDIWTAELVKSIIQKFSALEISHQDIESSLKSFEKDMKIAVYADGYLFKRSDSFFNRRKGVLATVNCNSNEMPTIRKNHIQEKFRELGLNKSNLYSFGSRYSISVRKHCYGHLVSSYCALCIVKYLKVRHSLKGVSNNIIFRTGLSTFFEKMLMSNELYEYYKCQFEKLKS